MPRRSDKAFLDDIVRAADHIASMAAGTSLEGYLANDVTRWAIERQLFIVGEATYRLQEAESPVYERLSRSSRSATFSLMGTSRWMIAGCGKSSRYTFPSCGTKPPPCSVIWTRHGMRRLRDRRFNSS